MPSPRRFFFAPLLAFALWGFAGQPWDRPAASWTPDDIWVLLNRSPWAQQSTASMADPRDAREELPAGPPDTGGTGNVPQQKQPWDGGVGRNRMGRLATIPVIVRWDSALPIREAQKAAAAPDSSYVISISGLVPAGRYRSAGTVETKSSSDDSHDARNPEEVLETFMFYSKLVLRGANEMHPENAKLDNATGIVRLFFARSKAIDPEQKEVVFVTQFGGLNVRAKFRLSNMKYHGNIQL